MDIKEGEATICFEVLQMYIRVPFNKGDKAKAAGAKWDPDIKAGSSRTTSKWPRRARLSQNGRILEDACRSRDQRSIILPDVNETRSITQSATVMYQEGYRPPNRLDAQC
ncbi:MAG: hypothetical protein HRT36_03770 [Alphaproteobacteria bacterium]|nr:hypothetical protein [Alphaproteobacteria bacterium]